MVYRYSTSYVINLININKNHRNLYFDLIFTKKNLALIFFLKKFNFIYNYRIMRISGAANTRVRLFLYYYQNKKIATSFFLASKPSHKFYVSYKALRLLSKKTGGTVYVLSTSKGLLSSRDALLQKTGGMVLGFFSL